MRRFAVCVVAVLLCLPVGCGGSHVASPAPAAPEEPASYAEPPADDTDVSSLEASLDREESELRSVLGAQAKSVGITQPAEAPPPEAPPEPVTPPTQESSGVALSAGSRCDRACRALSSMQRSADGICRMSADDDDRCVRAKGRVQQATELVQSAGCACS
jgi:hypothetical protein